MIWNWLFKDKTELPWLTSYSWIYIHECIYPVFIHSRAVFLWRILQNTLGIITAQSTKIKKLFLLNSHIICNITNKRILSNCDGQSTTDHRKFLKMKKPFMKLNLQNIVSPLLNLNDYLSAKIYFKVIHIAPYNFLSESIKISTIFFVFLDNNKNWFGYRFKVINYYKKYNKAGTECRELQNNEVFQITNSTEWILYRTHHKETN